MGHLRMDKLVYINLLSIKIKTFNVFGVDSKSRHVSFLLGFFFDKL